MCIKCNLQEQINDLNWSTMNRVSFHMTSASGSVIQIICYFQYVWIARSDVHQCMWYIHKQQYFIKAHGTYISCSHLYYVMKLSYMMHNAYKYLYYYRNLSHTYFGTLSIIEHPLNILIWMTSNADQCNLAFSTLVVPSR